MPDVVRWFLTPEQSRDVIILSSFLAGLILCGFTAYQVTPGAGFHCRLAFERLVHRVLIWALGMSMLYLAAFVQSNDRVPAGPVLLIVLFVFLSVMISAMRFARAPEIPEANNWKSRLPPKAIWPKT